MRDRVAILPYISHQQDKPPMKTINLLRDHGLDVMTGSCTSVQIREVLSGIDIVAGSPAMATLKNDSLSEREILRAISELNESGEHLGFVIVFA